VVIGRERYGIMLLIIGEVDVTMATIDLYLNIYMKIILLEIIGLKMKMQELIFLDLM